MTYDHELTLINQTHVSDAVGNQIPVETDAVILCGLKSVARAEFYNAALNGLKPEMVFVVHAYEYDGQKKVEFGSVRYNVIRTHEPNFEELELTCERIAADETTTTKLIDHKLVQDLKSLVEEILADATVVMDAATPTAYEDKLADALEGW
jgi:SPP1 family predicted phage head-tail adaptor